VRRALFRREDGTTVELWADIAWVSPDGAPAIASMYAQGEPAYFDDRARVWAYDGERWRVTRSHTIVGLAEATP